MVIFPVSWTLYTSTCLRPTSIKPHVLYGSPDVVGDETHIYMSLQDLPSKKYSLISQYRMFSLYGGLNKTLTMTSVYMDSRWSLVISWRTDVHWKWLVTHHLDNHVMFICTYTHRLLHAYTVHWTWSSACIRKVWYCHIGVVNTWNVSPHEQDV